MAEFMNKLYRAKNKANVKILLIAQNENEAVDIALKLRFVKNAENIKLMDISEEYMNSSRIAQGLNYDTLKPGKFYQICDGKSSTWKTYFPE